MRRRIPCFIAIAAAVSLCVPPARAQDTPRPLDRKINYSPYPAKTFPNRVYFGDTHLHTSYSADAGMIGAIVGPEEAYRFARGETVQSSTGLPARLKRPYDWLVVTDHAENLGLAPAVKEASYTNTIGAPHLAAYWKDPKFDPRRKAFYYVRVLEIPTPRWTTYDARFFGVARPLDVPAAIQERAYTTPIWYTP